jgi:hypothetical protein
LDALDGGAGLLARFVDANEVDGADGGPDLLAVGVAGDGNEALGAARLDADVMAGKFGVGVGVAGRARFEGADAGVVRVFLMVETGPRANRWLTFSLVKPAKTGLT